MMGGLKVGQWGGLEVCWWGGLKVGYSGYMVGVFWVS